jgi:hypothetical protein
LVDDDAGEEGAQGERNAKQLGRTESNTEGNGYNGDVEQLP